MSRPVWVGSLSFGLMHVPVRLYAAVSPKQVQFHLLHDADGARIQQKRVCSADGEEVPYAHVVKGYELEPGRYVEVTRGELEAFDPDASRTLMLEEFVDLGEVDPRLFDQTYHLVPDREAERPYALVLEALRRSGKVGIGRLVMHHKGHLCLVRPLERALSVSTLYYADELIAQDSLEELRRAGAAPSAEEVEMALRLVEARVTSFEPRRYQDVHRERLLAFLERRARAQARLPRVAGPGAPARLPAAHAVPERGDLLRALEESLAALGPRRSVPSGAEVRALPESGELRVRAQAARTVRERQPEPARPTGKKGGEEPN